MNTDAKPTLPKHGKIIGWKKLRDKLIAKLEIPARAKRVMCQGPTRKCRASVARVLTIYIGCPHARKWNEEHGQTNETRSGVSCFSRTLAHYVVGKTVIADMFDPRPNVECSHGINFFLSREEAEAYDPR
jgi:hypothetical protein